MANTSVPKQTVASLTCMLGCVIGLPLIMVGGHLTKFYGNGIIITSICIGNFILWLLGLAILSMVEKGTHALDNIKYYLGKPTCAIAAIIWVVAFIMWYVLRLKTTTRALESLFPEYTQPMWIVGIIVGLICAILGMGELRWIRKIATVIFPFLIGFALYSLLTIQNPIALAGSWGFSFVGCLYIIFVGLPFILNLPTIFRYAESKAVSVLSLTLITISHIFFQLFALLTGFDRPVTLLPSVTSYDSLPNIILIILFVLFASIIVNLVNLYFVKPALDIFSRTDKRGIKPLFLGCFATIVYIFIWKAYYPTKFWEELIEGFVSVLAVVLIYHFFIRAIIQHRPRPLEKFWGSVCWIGGCITSVIAKWQGDLSSEITTFIGIIACSLLFLVLIFIEETIWSIKHIRDRSK